MKSGNIIPPQFAQKILLRFLRSDLAEEVVGDLDEKFYSVLKNKSLFQAKLNYWYQVFNYVRPFAIRKSKAIYLNEYAMFQSYFKIAFRNFRKHRTFSLINVSGLAIGMACCILIFAYVQQELAYDKHHPHFDNIYRLLEGSESTGRKSAIMPGVLLPYLKNEIPEIQEAIRIHKKWNSIVSYQHEQYAENGFLFADPEIINIFSLPLTRGNKNNLLADPSSVFITESTAEKYFGDEDPMGKSIQLDNAHMFTITGILKDIPNTSHFKFSFLAPMVRMMNIHKGILEDWDITGTYIYFLIQENANIPVLEHKILEVALKHNPNIDEATQATIDSLQIKSYLEPLREVHLYSAGTEWDFLADKGDITYVSGAAITGILLLAIAGFNFMNLTTAQASHRAKEIGIKKMLGVNRKQLVFQFYTETFLYTLSAMIIGILLAGVLLPPFNQLTGKQLSFDLFSNHLLLATIILLGLIVFLMAGSYPVFYLSGLQPSKNLKDSGTASSIHIADGNLKMHFRHLLVMGQFVISITLIISSVLIARQNKLMAEVNLGFDKENVLVVDNPWDDKMVRRYKSFTREISRSSSVSKIGSANMVPAGVISDHTFIRKKETPDEEKVHAGKVSVGPQFFETIGAEIIAGKGFSENDVRGTSNSVILNETAVKKMQLHDPVGANIDVEFMNGSCQVIGIVKDMQYESLHVPTKAVVYFVQSPANISSILVKIKSHDLNATLAYLEEQWKRIDDKWPFRYQFMDDRLQQMYRAELSAQKIINTFAALTVFISCLGLFGLASFTASHRTKEIGIRKVMGASVQQMVLMLSQDFSKWIIISFVISCPIAYWIMSRWLQNFAYKTEMSWWIFASAGILVVTVSILTTSYQTIKTATANPVDSLRSE